MPLVARHFICAGVTASLPTASATLVATSLETAASPNEIVGDGAAFRFCGAKDGEPLTTNGECPRIGGLACGLDKEDFFGPETTQEKTPRFARNRNKPPND